LTSSSAAPPDTDPIVSALDRMGWSRARPIGGRDGLVFVEAFR
jgi:hypothetical protein